MPDARVPADAGRLPITRRGLLAGSASIAATTLAPPCPTQAEDELTSLGRGFEQALWVHREARHALDDCEQRYLRDGPQPPLVLTDAGPLGHA
jgi:hypothetical protein